MTAESERLRAARTRLAAARESGVGVEEAEHDAKVQETFAAVDALIDRRAQQTRMGEARREATAAGRDPEQAARLAARDPAEPIELAATVERRRALNAALDQGKITPAERKKFEAGMNADQAAAIALLASMPEGRVPLAPTAQVWPSDQPGPPLGPGGMLPPSMSLLSSSERAELQARRPSWDA